MTVGAFDLVSIGDRLPFAGALDQVNIPGTVNEHPNWRRKLPVALEDIAAHPDSYTGRYLKPLLG